MDNELGFSHRQYIHGEILVPLNLTNNYSLLAEVYMEDVVSGFYVDYDQEIKYNDFVTPGGSMVATAKYVGIFLRALNDGFQRMTRRLFILRFMFMNTQVYCWDTGV